MLMEPDDFRATAISPTAGFYRSNEFRPLHHEYVHLHRPNQPRARSIDDGPPPTAQNFFPPPYYRNAAPPLGHSRPYFPVGEPPFGGRIHAGRSFDQSILGSGDFGVIRGGTFYQEDDPPPRSLENQDYLGFINNNNGHGRPQNPFSGKTLYHDDQFANFRDFADINTPNDSAYSQFVVVYANKNSTESHPNPKNIFEQLELLDKEKQDEHDDLKKKSISKFKKKLAGTKLEKKYKKKSIPKEEKSAGDFEPLLALS